MLTGNHQGRERLLNVMFSTPAKDVNQSSAYLAARQEWNERYGSLVAREHMWKMGFFIMAVITLICVIGMAYTSAQSKFVPYVVQVDKLGSAVPVQRADTAQKPDTRVVRAQLARWIESIRSVYQDAGAERKNINYAYGMLRRTDPAFSLLNEYMSKHDPFERAKKEGITVQIRSVLPISGKTWQVQWTESVHSSKGEPIETKEYQANLTIDITPPTKEAILLKNPMGIYIKNFEWSERL